MVDFALITEHPDSKEIISKLLSGTQPKDVCQWLKIKYSEKDEAHLRLSQKLLKDFNDSQYTNVYDQFKRDLVNVNSKEKALPASLLNNKTYKDRLQDIADKEFNILKALDNVIVITHDRMEQVFDRIQENPQNFDGDHVLLKWINTLFEISEKLEKIRIGSPESNMQQTLNSKVIEDYMTTYQDAIRETLAEMDQDMAMLFMDKLYSKLNKLKPPVYMNQNERMQEATVLAEKFV